MDPIGLRLSGRADVCSRDYLMYPKSDLDSGEDIPKEIEANTEAHPFLLPVLCNDVSFLPPKLTVVVIVLRPCAKSLYSA